MNGFLIIVIIASDLFWVLCRLHLFYDILWCDFVLESSGNVDFLTWLVSIIATLPSTWAEPWPTKRTPALSLRQAEHNAADVNIMIQINKLASTDALWVANVIQEKCVASNL